MFRRQHYDSLIIWYYKCLSENIKKLGSDPGRLFRFDDLKNELKRHGAYGTIIGMLLTLLKFCGSADMIDFHEFCESLDDEKSSNIFHLSERTLATFRKELSPLIEDAVRLDYVHDCCWRISEWAIQ